MELHIDCKVVAHARHIDKASAASMYAVDDFGDRRAVGTAHNCVTRAVNDQHGDLDLLPELPEIERLELLVERGWPPVLTIRLVVPQGFPLRMLANDLARRLALNQVQIVKLAERLHSIIHFCWGFAVGGQAHALVFKHVLVPGATPGTCGDEPRDVVVA